jgi:hypothetical protein
VSTGAHFGITELVYGALLHLAAKLRGPLRVGGASLAPVAG